MSKTNKAAIAVFAALHESITNRYIESMFRNRDYEDLSPREQIELLNVLKRTFKIDVRYQA